MRTCSARPRSTSWPATALQVCSTAGWGAVDLTGAPGDAGADGTDGSNGMDGGRRRRAGRDGDDLPRTRGRGVLQRRRAHRGRRGRQRGRDADPRRGGPIAHVCNGMNGHGSASDETLLTTLSTPDAAMGCEAGGRVMAQGLDNGDGDGVARNGILESGEADARTVFCSTLDFDRVTDVNGGTNNSYPGFYMEVRVGDTLYFDSDDGVHGRELWAYGIENGTTWMVADINPGSDWSYRLLPRDRHWRQHLLRATTPNYGFEMWNTVTGITQRVTDINPGAGGCNFGEHANRAGDLLYFSAFDPVTFTELWAYDTVSGTLQQVMDIMPGSSANPGWYMHVVHGDTLYFSAKDPPNGFQLWAHDTVSGITWR